jgi:hypothetical protein
VYQPIYKLGPDAYVEWSGAADGPLSHVMTREEAHATYPAERMARVEANGHSGKDGEPRTPESLVSVNRAGPNESCLTLTAILRLYAPGMPDPARIDQTELQVSDIQPTWSNWFTDDGKPDDADGPIYAWCPWRPGEEPDRITAETDLHDHSTRIGRLELARLTGRRSALDPVQQTGASPADAGTRITVGGLSVAFPSARTSDTAPSRPSGGAPQPAEEPPPAPNPRARCRHGVEQRMCPLCQVGLR